MNDIVEIDDEPINEFDDYSEDNSTEQLESAPPVDDQQNEDEGGKPTNDEPEEFSRKVQKRIDKLVYERNIEREERQRELEENRTLREKLEQLENRLNQSEQEKSNNDYQSRIAQLKSRKVELYDSGDYEEAAELDDEIIELKLKQRESQGSKPPKDVQRDEVVQNSQPNQQQAPQVPEAQAAWLESNDWYFNPRKAQMAQSANAVYLNLVNEGYDPNDEGTYAELDKRLGKNRQTPPPTLPPDRGQASSSSKQVKFTQDDASKLRSWGLDPNDVEVRKEYLKNKKAS